MNIQETLNFLALQEQVANLMIKMAVLEDMLIDKGVFTAEEYSGKLSDKVALIADKIKPIQEELDKLKEIENSNGDGT